MFARKDIAGASHIGGQLVNGMHPTNSVLHHAQIAQVAANEFIRGCRRELRVFKIYAADPKTLLFEPPCQMTADESASAGHQHSGCVISLSIHSRFAVDCHRYRGAKSLR